MLPVAGICAGIRLMQMKNFGTDCVIKIFEQSNMLGGTWVYTDDPNAHSSMYDTLRCGISFLELVTIIYD